MDQFNLTIPVDEITFLELSAQKHAAALFKTMNENRRHLSEFLGWVDKMKSENDTTNYLKNCESLYSQGLESSFVIFHAGELVGRIGIHYIHPQNKTGAIGYWLSQKATGKGIITNCCRKILNYAFETLYLNRIEIKAATKNYKSQAIPERLGFVREGILRQGELVDQTFVDLFLYSFLRSDWTQKMDVSN